METAAPIEGAAAGAPAARSIGGSLLGRVFVLTVAAGEAAVGLAILVTYFRSRGTIAVDDVDRLKG